MRGYAVLVCLLIAICALGCGSSAVSPTPTPVPTPAPPTPAPGGPVNMAGNWVGTLEFPNLEKQPITMLAVQTTNCVDGAWRSSASDWSGAISGFAENDVFAGQVSFERPASGGRGRCSAVGETSGPVGTGTLTWTVTGLRATGQCDGELAEPVVLSMRRQ